MKNALADGYKIDQSEVGTKILTSAGDVFHEFRGVVPEWVAKEVARAYVVGFCHASGETPPKWAGHSLDR